MSGVLVLDTGVFGPELSLPDSAARGSFSETARTATLRKPGPRLASYR